MNEIYNNLQIYNKDEINISAKDIIDILKREPGKYIKEIYRDLEFKIVNNIIKNDEDILKKYVKENYFN